jgi:phospholipid/cholesterol/gamma-HCH transport system substrate-binding protein
MRRRTDILVGLLLLTTFLLALAAAGFALSRSDLFRQHQFIKIAAETGAGLAPGLPVVYKGFPIGRIDSILLTDNGLVEITLRIPEEEMRWIKETTRFVFEQSFFGAGSILVETPDLDAPEFSGRRIKELQKPDVVKDIMAQAQPVIDQIEPILADIKAITGAFADPNNKNAVPNLLNNLQAFTQRLEDGEPLIDLATGKPEISQNLVTVTADIAAITGRAKEQITGQEGLLLTLRQNLLTLDTQLQALGPVLSNVEGITANIEEGTQDLGNLRREVDNMLLTVKSLLQGVDSQLSFLRADQEMQVP